MARRKIPPPHRRKSDRRPKGAKPPPSDSPVWLYGLHTVLAALANPARRCSRLVVCDRALTDRVANIDGTQAKPPAELVSRAELDALLPDGAVHQGIALLAAPLAPVSLEDVCARIAGRPSSSVIVLDQVSDPHNIGAILRTAAAFEAGAVVVQDRHTPPVTGVLAKAASGGLEHCPLVRVTNLARALERLKQAGVWCIGLDGSAPDSLRDAKVAGPTALVLGAEGGGLRRLTSASCDALARIPHGGPIASLNVSNAAAVALYELAQSGTAEDT